VKAAALFGSGDLRLVEKPVPRPGPGDARVRVEYCGICGSDIHAYRSGFFPVGMTIGHEYAGKIDAVGEGVEERWRPGLWVTGNNILGCGVCSACIRGADHHCTGMCRLGVTAEGAMAEYLLAPVSSLFPIPEEVPLEWGTLTEPFSVAVHGINLSGVKPSDTAVILGAGTIGLCLLAELKGRGLSHVLVVEPDPARIQAAVSMGAAAAFPPGGAARARVFDQTAGQGADIVFECAGLPDTIAEAPRLARRGGAAVILGICHEMVEMDFSDLVTREVRLVNACGKTSTEFGWAVEQIVSGRVSLAPVISRIIPLDRIAEGFTLPGKTVVRCNN
jgi:threonine dehydrogenase-like Zn-dependent dehydrogenase